MPLMTIFEPLFLALALTTVVSLLVAVGRLLGGQVARARRILTRVVVGAVIYLAVAAVVSIARPRRIYGVAEPQCFDDWCITVGQVDQTMAPTGLVYDVDLVLTNRSRGTPMGERGTVVYLVDAAGRRFDPVPDITQPGLETRLLSGQSLTTRRHFLLPRGTEDLQLIFTHEGGFPIGWFVIGEGGWFGKPPAVTLPAPVR
jgi:hypothetical protein